MPHMFALVAELGCFFSPAETCLDLWISRRALQTWMRIYLASQNSNNSPSPLLRLKRSWQEFKKAQENCLSCPGDPCLHDEWLYHWSQEKNCFPSCSLVELIRVMQTMTPN
ncbi:hypothetical protein AVEN_106336-1 [Araneus ventricosus]|uniref:Uncharacterized protein n=1 Tax=Araneus ventricosus TaxID=182803 RepID=A0A4Y2ATG6_ARAVE|nr:hypothetical protein AVEN_106336-1 [Araneus ventricosus]